MRNLKVSKCLTILVATGVALSLTGCNIGAGEVITENEINSKNEHVIFNYDNGDGNIDYTRTNVKTFDVGEHVLLMKIAGVIGYDSSIQIENIPGYEIADFTYGENAIGEYGNTYGYLTFMYKNIEPVQAVGYYDKDKGEYVYLDFGNVIEKSKEQILQ